MLFFYPIIGFACNSLSGFMTNSIGITLQLPYQYINLWHFCDTLLIIDWFIVFVFYIVLIVAMNKDWWLVLKIPLIVPIKTPQPCNYHRVVVIKPDNSTLAINSNLSTIGWINSQCAPNYRQFHCATANEPLRVAQDRLSAGVFSWRFKYRKYACVCLSPSANQTHCALKIIKNKSSPGVMRLCITREWISGVFARRHYLAIEKSPLPISQYLL